MKKTCAICGNEYDELELTEVHDGDLVCKDCLDEGFVQCADCGEWVPEDVAQADCNGDMICEDCLDADYALCDHCQEYHPIDDVAPVDDGDEFWCETCREDSACQCSDCGEWFTYRNISLHDDWARSDSADAICYRCADGWFQCADCGHIFREEDGMTDDWDWYCRDCWNENHDDSVIHDYGYKPYPEIARRAGESRDALTFGVELEVDDGDDAKETAERVLSIGEGRVYCKHDGSLDDGFEIVSHPGTLAHHMYELRWRGICSECIDGDFKSHDAGTCGLHIHVGRDQLGGDDVIARIIVLACKLKPALVNFSRRTDTQLARWAAFPDLDVSSLWTSDDDLETDALRTERYGRYQAVNLQNDATIEFRIFRGSLVRDTIIASLQLVNNICKYAMSHDMAQCRSAMFADVVDVEPYKELVAYCAKRSLIAANETGAPAAEPMPA